MGNSGMYSRRNPSIVANVAPPFSANGGVVASGSARSVFGTGVGNPSALNQEVPLPQGNSFVANRNVFPSNRNVYKPNRNGFHANRGGFASNGARLPQSGTSIGYSARAG